MVSSGIVVIVAEISPFLPGNAYYLPMHNHREDAVANGVFLIGINGLIINIAVMYTIHGSHDLNVKSAFLHVFGDTLSSVGVIAAALWTAFTGQMVVDPFLSIAIAVLIMVSSFSILREAFAILLQFAPSDVDTEAVIREIESVNGVDGVHNVHLWSHCSNINVLDAHVYSCETDTRRLDEIKAEIKHRLEKFRIGHSTLEFECRECEDCRRHRELRD
ncbi:MAG: cation diffusion facilitator family transporter [Methanoregula sp.]|jgi:cobalt-zinc-cadmium efflux system protein|nr:cation diffusion facilitator family transporter [Methanoregula sp.]